MMDVKGIPFHKYHCNALDYIIIDDKNCTFGEMGPRTKAKFVMSICDQRRGVGATSGLMFVYKPQNKTPDKTDEQSDELAYGVRYFHRKTGKESTFCGTGSICSAQYALSQGYVSPGVEFTFYGVDGPHRCVVNPHEPNGATVEVQFRQVRGFTFYDPDNCFVVAGSPFHVRLVDGLATYDVPGVGAEISSQKRYEEIGKTNVTFVEPTENGIAMRSYFRGVEIEAWACGTGSVASSLVTCIARQHLSKSNTQNYSYEVQCKGGSFTTRFTHIGNLEFKDVFLESKVVEICSGSFLYDEK